MGKLKVLELFGGIGAPRKALQRLGIEHEVVDYVEIDKFAVKSYNAIFNENYEPQDILTWDKDLKVDMIFHGSPCQDFSLAGKQAGGDKDSGTRSSLLYETVRIVRKLRPKYVVWENVKNVISKKHKHTFDNYLHEMELFGYTNYYQVLNAKDYGIPQNRERVFTISILGVHNIFNFPQKQELKLKLKDMLEDEVDEKYYLSGDIVKKITNTKHKKFTNNNLQIEPIDYRYDEGLRNRVDKEIIPTLTCKVGTSGFSGQPLLKIKEATKKGYKEAYEGDSVNLEQPNSQTRRGRVGNQVAQTLTTSCNQGVVEKPRKDIKELERYCEYCDKQLERKRFNGRLEDFTVFTNRKYCNRECMKRDYLKIGDSHDQNYSNAHTTARKINELILHKEVCEECGGTQNLDIHHIDGNWQNNNFNNLECLCRSCHMKEHKSKEQKLRIRKLTPLEVWRLMGFDDDDFIKAEQENSNTQLYKQAGNSIVVNVLMAIFKELIKCKEQ